MGMGNDGGQLLLSFGSQMSPRPWFSSRACPDCFCSVDYCVVLGSRSAWVSCDHPSRVSCDSLHSVKFELWALPAALGWEDCFFAFHFILVLRAEVVGFVVVAMALEEAQRRRHRRAVVMVLAEAVTICGDGADGGSDGSGEEGDGCGGGGGGSVGGGDGGGGGGDGAGDCGKGNGGNRGAPRQHRRRWRDRRWWKRHWRRRRGHRRR